MPNIQKNSKRIKKSTFLYDLKIPRDPETFDIDFARIPWFIPTWHLLVEKVENKGEKKVKE